MRAALSFTLALLALTSMPLRAATPVRSAGPVPFALGEGVFVLVPVVVGQTRATFLLDTGANRSAVSRRLATRLGLQVTAESTVVTSAGSTTAGIVLVPELSFGPQVRRSLPALLAADATLDAISRGIDGGIDGVLGQDVLLDANYTVDYRRSRIVWDEARDEHGTRLTLRADEGRWLVALPQSARGNDGPWFVPDSGASAFVLFERDGVNALATLALPTSAAATTLNGSGRGKGVLIPRLRVGDVLFQDRPAIAIDRRDPGAPAGDGLLPLCAFASVTFNARAGYMVVREW